MAFIEKIIVFFQDRIHNLTDKEKKRYILICTAVVVVIMVLSVLLPLRSSVREDRLEEPHRSIRLAIPPQELFLPDEPDFIPGVLLERERRLSWTEQDASEYWQDPLRDGEEPWREKIEEAINEFMERIP
jgi:hypothetical protein